MVATETVHWILKPTSNSSLWIDATKTTSDQLFEIVYNLASYFVSCDGVFPVRVYIVGCQHRIWGIQQMPPKAIKSTQKKSKYLQCPSFSAIAFSKVFLPVS